MIQVKWLWDNLKGYRKKYCIALILSVLCNILYITSPYFQSQIVDIFISNENAVENLIEKRDLLLWLIGGMIFFTLVRVCFQYACNMYYETASQGMIYRIRTGLFRSIEDQDMEFYDTFRTGDLMTRMTGDLDMCRHMVSWVIKGVVESVALFLASMAYFFVIDWHTAICILMVTPSIFLITRLLSREAGPAHEAVREKSSALNTAAQENISGNRVVKAFAREEYEIERFSEKNTEYAVANKKAARIWLKYQPFMDFAAGALGIVLLLCGGLFIIHRQLTMGQYIAISGLLWAVSNPMRNMGSYVNDFNRFLASAKKIMEICAVSPEVIDRKEAVETEERLRGEVEFRNVSFWIDDKQILDHISFRIPAGKTFAVMGATGSGKTSLINLIPRLYDVDQGEVLIDGINVKNYKLKSLRKNIGVAAQDVLLYSDTIDGNIAFGDSSLSEEEVIQCAELSDADEFIRELPKQYETIVGERGVGLSGGQKQRISLARAIAIKPAILILDDTTSAVDMETESMIQDSLQNDLGFTCTKIIIAQRISSAKNADQIMILENGRITAIGRHEELIQQDGYYKQIYELQSGTAEA